MIPSKVVYTKKPGLKGRKRKVRWVVCGNFESKSAEEETYSSGADATAFRLLCWVATQHQWQGYVVGVKTAFLNANMNDTTDTQWLLVAPPSLFVEKGLLPKGVMYIPEKAIYGLRRSRRLWSEHWDRILESLEVKLEDHKDPTPTLVVRAESVDDAVRGGGKS